MQSNYSNVTHLHTHNEQLALINKVEEFRQAERDLKVAKEYHELLKKELLDAMIDKTEIVNQAGHVILRKTVSKAPMLFDKKLFDLENPGVSEQYTKLGSSRITLKLL